MNQEPGWYDDPDPWYVRYWDGSAWAGRRPRYPADFQAESSAHQSVPVPHAATKATWALAVSALFALNDVAVLPIGYSPLSDTNWALISAIAVPVGTIAALLLLILYVRGLRLEWANGLAICIGLVMVLSFPIGMLVTSGLHSFGVTGP
ncbi:hypothetical protein DEI92_15670 [Curtobacterium sp. MCBD17_034]|nr:hypothetical protein DEI86_15050 [Curtobacterium sp. MCBD17_028]PZE72847.1 hypothetical protein DEI82_14590 [Curtobacterium sp. MCBD17_019]PZF56074.1 hypothetical protein DEI92_15670 [Curtobacterium sp. MCBD17_034]PZM32942.1 hypothetical protein DEI90_15535 [Curtobacterium sp. MCBD17_031]